MLVGAYGNRCECCAEREVREAEPVSSSEYEVQWKCTKCAVVSLELRQSLPVTKPLWYLYRESARPGAL
jgi:hypothetical protein